MDSQTPNQDQLIQTPTEPFPIETDQTGNVKLEITEEEEEEEVDDIEEANGGFANFYLPDDEDEDDLGIMMKDKAEIVAHAIVENGMPSPPDGGWGWVIVAAAFFTFVVLDGCTSSFGILLPSIVETFQKDNPNIGRSHVAWAGSLLGGFSLFIGPIVSALTNKFGCRVITITGALISAVGFVGASYSPNLPVLLVTYGLIGGLGAGFLYLPAIVCVGYYFESKRALATGIALSGSGIGAILFAPVITAISSFADWRIVCLGFGGMAAMLTITGSLMRPLEISIEPIESSESKIPLLQRIAEDKKQKMELMGSDYFMVQLPDGSMEKRLKKSANVDPGVHSVLYLDQLAQSLEQSQPQSNLPTISSTVDILPPISEANNPTSPTGNGAVKNELAKSVPTGPDFTRPRSLHKHMSHAEYLQTPASIRDATPPNKTEAGGGALRAGGRTRTSSQGQENSPMHSRERRHSEGGHSPTKTGTPSTGQSQGKSRATRRMTRDGTSITSKGSDAQFCYESMMVSSKEAGLADSESGRQPVQRRYSIKAVPSSSSFNRKTSFTDSGQLKTSVSNMRESRRDLFDEDYRFLLSTRSDSIAQPLIRKISVDRKPSVDNSDHSRFIIRPMSRKDIFYSGSITNLPEYQSQDLSGYHQSIINLAKKDFEEDVEKAGKPGFVCCPGLTHKTGAFKAALSQMMDFSLIKNPIFLTVAISSVFGMLGFFVPIVYVIDYSVKQGIDADSAAYFISIIGITSTVGRVGFGLISDRPWVNSVMVYNICILVMGVSTFMLPFCFNYYLIAFMYFCFGTALSGFIALSSIILVELLGLENLTNAFGLLIFFRGISSVLGTPLSGAIFDATQSYDIPFHLAGVFLIVASLITFMIPCVSKFAPPKPLLEPRRFSLGPLEDILEEGGETSGSEDHDNSVKSTPIKKNGTCNGVDETHANA